MNPFWWGLFVGVPLGAILGMLVMALCIAAARQDREYERLYQVEMAKGRQ